MTGKPAPQSIPRHDRVSTETDMFGNQTVTYWDKRYTGPVHIEYIPAPPVTMESTRPLSQ